MSTKQLFLAVSIFAVCGWVVFVSLSLWQARNSLSGLLGSSFERPAVQSPDKTVAAAEAQAEIHPPKVVTAVEVAPAIVPAIIAPPEISVEAAEDESTLEYSGEDQLIALDPAEVQARCWLLAASEAYADERTRDDSWPPSYSLDERKAMAVFRDYGFDNLVSGERLRWWMATSPYAERSRNGTFKEFSEHPVTKAMEGYYVRAVRSHTRGAATRLASLYSGFDKNVEARAWLLVEQWMGGSSLSKSEQSRGSLSPPSPYEFTEAEKLESEVRAEELIIEHNLGSGLGVPEECLTDEEVEEQRTRLSALYDRLSRRAMPSEAPGAGLAIFQHINGRDLAVENVCSLNCPADTQRVIYYQDTADESCSQVEGTERTILARSPIGTYEERTFCIPRFLTEASRDQSR